MFNDLFKSYETDVVFTWIRWKFSQDRALIARGVQETVHFAPEARMPSSFANDHDTIGNSLTPLLKFFGFFGSQINFDLKARSNLDRGT